jgi:putative flippase GtrA
MTVLYLVGVNLSFLFNKKWTFRHKGNFSLTFASYLFIYACGYLVNLAGLYLLVDKLGFRHEWVQGVLIAFIALLLFTAQKTIVFGNSAK